MSCWAFTGCSEAPPLHLGTEAGGEGRRGLRKAQAGLGLTPTFCSTVFSSEWICIWAFRRLAWKAKASAWALLRTWVISSFALEGAGADVSLARPSPITRLQLSPTSTHSLSFSSAWAFSAWYLWPSFSILTM